MKTIYSFIFGLILVALFGLKITNAQIQVFDSSKYYQIFMATGGNITGGNVIGVPTTEPNTQIAQMEPSMIPNVLWQIIEVTDSTYRLINKATGLALDRTTERPATSSYKGDGTHDDIGKEYENSGWPNATDKWPAIAVQEDNESTATQEWAIIPIDPENHPEDTVYYSIINMGMGYDSLFSINVWRKRSGPDFIGTQNFCLISYIVTSDDLKDAEATLYFIKSDLDIPVPIVSVNEIENKTFQVLTNNSNITIKGIEYGQLVKVYSILGTLVLKQNANSSEVNISLENSGIYIIKIGNFTSKILIK